ncbi:MAG: right-handed parallel beta-helix repeat-containing protein [Cytophagales bacterium]|nr:right-handed parallel beta-helix repeat-containing protein [Cytophagales bacterium]
MKNIIQALLTAFIVFVSCTPEEEKISSGSIQPLVFSTDTVIFDTIFTQIGSITKRLIVGNPNENAVSIGSIALAGGSNSPYTILVDGVAGDRFEDEIILGNDSLLVLVSVLIDPRQENLPFLVKDSIVFTTNNILQDVKLISYGQDANFLNDSILVCNAVWDSEKPYVLSNSVLVDALCTLTVKKGVKVLSDNDSFIFVKGKLIVEGDVESPVLFSNSRLDEDFANAPGQWGGIIFLPGSKENKINFTAIRNARVGLNLDTFDNDTLPEVVVSNTVIENMSASGILTIGADVYATNVLINNCAEFMTGNFGGGYHTYIHCTLSNSQSDFFRQNPSFTFTDNFSQNDRTLVSDLVININNSIIWGDLDEELLFDVSGGTGSVLLIANSILKTNLELDINNNLLNENPRFLDPANFDYRLDTLSPAKDAGIPGDILFDLDANPRDENPDLGAYERIENN